MNRVGYTYNYCNKSKAFDNNLVSPLEEISLSLLAFD